MRTDVLHAVRLARVDLKLLGRNQTALVNVLLLPLLMGWLFSNLVGGQTIEGVSGPLYVLTGLPGMMVGFAVFVNLVNTFTARREELVLKRLRGSQPSAAAILGGAVLGALAVYLLQVGLAVLWIVRWEDGPPPANVPLMLVGAVLGVAVMGLLAAAFAGITPNAETAQVAVLPMLLLIMVGAPIVAPTTNLPGVLGYLAEAVPVTPVVEIMRTAYLGRDFLGGGGEPLAMGAQWVAALPSIGIALAWVAVSALLARWLFRWDPRHG
ncbi:ABC transporter permease [Spongiactinospora sp. TRM90649]|uniref:ABC transporter permease n=1 Tax=Spongiactinospora sp. TRM90649 TaxID=3031114 RepID=UPI0023F8B13A|nr:ABC transporter permease [Spongiactinospora sp. TRM90649]MDF5752556.1 ABC transporter permease [Spongiactinospora sp. TRM90649]